MATARLPLVLVSGETRQIQPGDTLVSGDGLPFGLGSVAVAVTGTQNGSNLSFTLASAIVNTALVFLNGQLLVENVDYSLSGTVLAFITAPISTDVIQAFGYTGAAAPNNTLALMDNEVTARLNLAILR